MQAVAVAVPAAPLIKRVLPFPQTASIEDAGRPASVIAFAERRRLVARGYVSPVRDVPAAKVDNERTRFLDPEEQVRLLRTPSMHARVLGRHSFSRSSSFLAGTSKNSI